MRHALIIDDNLVVSKALEQRLAGQGFTSFAHAWSEAEAIDLAARQRPDLVVVGDTVEKGSGIEAARLISDRYGAPALLVTADSSGVRRRLPEGVAIGGPFLLDDMDAAVASAQEMAFSD